MKKNINIYGKVIGLILCFSIVLVHNSCEDQFKYLLPEADSIADTEFPMANFSYASALEDFKTIKFTNLSNESISYLWDFGGGNTSAEKDPTFTFEAGEGTYPVTLTSSDGNGETGSTTIEVMVVEGPFQPIILEPGFELNSLPDGSGDGRDSWRKSELGGVIQITSSPVTFGDKGAKLPNDQSRIGYQEIAVEPNTNYDLRFWYTMLADPTDPFVTVSIVGVTQAGGSIESKEAAAEATIASLTANDISDPDVYLEEKLSFNSGENNTVAIYFFNGPVEARLDNFSIEVGAEGAVPPSAGFDVAQSEVDFLEYTFTNSSTNAASYEWDFGDGNTSTEESPTHIYETPADYTVTLVAKSDVGLSATLSKNITILAPVTADFTFLVDPEDYRTYTFMDASEGAVMLLWEFGDGYQFTGMNPSHVYEEDGIYTVSLTAYSLTGNTHVSTAELTVAEGFIVKVLNGTFDEFVEKTSDNADAWDMTPNSTVVDNDGNEVPSPYRELWNNTELNNYIDGAYCDSEQPNSTSDGAFADGSKTRGGKFSASCRRLYQLVQVQQGEDYIFSIDTRSEVEGINTEVFILNTEITTEVGIDADKNDAAIDAYVDITNDFNSDKSMFTKTTLPFTASSNQIVIYVRALGAVDSDNEVFLDNVEVIESE